MTRWLSDLPVTEFVCSFEVASVEIAHHDGSEGGWDLFLKLGSVAMKQTATDSYLLRDFFI